MLSPSTATVKTTLDLYHTISYTVVMDKRQKLKEIEIKCISPDPDAPNIRGVVRDTTDLQPSIKEQGVVDPLWVRPHEEVEGEYLLIDGERRLIAARQVGLQTVPCLVKYGVTTEQVHRFMLIRNLQKAQPEIVIDANGQVVGGKVFVVRQEVDRGTPRYVLADILGEKPDVVGAYYCLWDEPLELKQRVVKGQLAITVYSLMKRQPMEMKMYILRKKGQITADYVRTVKRNWDAIKKKLDEERGDAEDEAGDDAEPAEKELPEPNHQPEEVTVARCLNEAVGWLAKIDGRQLSHTDRYLLEKLADAVIQLQEN